MTSNIDDLARTLTPFSEATGDDPEDTSLLRAMGAAAVRYAESMSWCARVVEARLGFGVGGLVGVFLVKIVPRGGADEWVWVVTGDLPSAYLVLDRAPNAMSALSVYCEVMDRWIESVRSGEAGNDVFPVEVPPTHANAAALATRIEFIRNELLPSH